MNQKPACDRQCVDYLLGMMNREASVLFEAELDADPVLRDELAAWRERIGMLAGALRPNAPRGELRQAILRAVQSEGGEPTADQPPGSNEATAGRAPPRRAKSP